MLLKRTLAEDLWISTLNDDTSTDCRVFTTFRSKLGEMEKQQSYASLPEIIAEPIYQAATDGTKSIPICSSPDTKMLINMRENTDEIEYLTNIAQHLS